MKQTVHVLVFDGLADWEPAHALCELRRSGKFDVRSVGFSPQPVITMAGLKVAPDLSIDGLKPQTLLCCAAGRRHVAEKESASGGIAPPPVP
jgi:hypothetical protein